MMRPSDGQVPQRIAFIQCVGSRDEGLGLNYCSNICCVTALKQAITVMDKIEGSEVTVFYSDIRPFSRNAEHFYLKARDQYGIKFIQSKVDQVMEDSESTNLFIKFSKNGLEATADFDIVVLSTGISSTAGFKRLSRQVGARLNKYGFFPNSVEAPIATAGEDVWLAGSLTYPTDLSDSLAQASAVAAKVMQSFIKKELQFNGKLEHPIKVKERKQTDRVGVFFCRYGLSTQLNIDADDVINSLEKSNKNIIVEELEYGCNATAKRKIIESIEKNDLGRVIIAPCYSDQNHLTMFQQLIESVGLSSDRFNIFDTENQNGGWNTEDIKQKLLELINSEPKILAAGKAEPGLTTEAAVIGDSVTVLQSAWDIAEQGFDVHLLVKESKIAQSDQQIYWHYEKAMELIGKLSDQVSNHSRIKIHYDSRLNKLEGNSGAYQLTFSENGAAKTIQVGAIVIAPGAESYQPNEFEYGKNKNVITQRELSKLITEKDFPYRKVVMIQCVGSRQPDRPYCSQICCEQAIKNALNIKTVQPEAEISILHRDIRVYDFEEDNYTEAIEKDVNFIRMDQAPEISSEDGKFNISVIDRLTSQQVKLEADLIVLSAGIIPHRYNQTIAKAMDLPQNSDGFFSGEDDILKPLHSKQPGIFIAGLAHSPQRLEHALMQASAVAGKIGVMFRNEKQ
jgi:heterodisulfide reductase subunit A